MYFPLSLCLSLTHLFTTHCILLVRQSSCIHVVTIKPSGLASGEAHVPHSDARTHARTTVFPPSRICSIFPPRIWWHTPDKPHPASFELPGAKKKKNVCEACETSSIIIHEHHYFATVCVLSMNFPPTNCRRPPVSSRNIRILLLSLPKIK